MIDVGNFIRIERDNSYRVWKITGIHLGGINQENLVTLKTVDQRPGVAYGHVILEMTMPLHILETHSTIEKL